MICAICGREINDEQINMTKFYPKAVYKWLKPAISEDQYTKIKTLINSSNNTIYTCRNCNNFKQEKLLSIKSLYIDDEKKDQLYELRNKLDFYYQAYYRIKQYILLKQHFKCYHCGKEIYAGIIRRKSTAEDRTINNACCLCYNCNHLDNFRDDN